MSEEVKKVEENEQQAEISDEALDQVAGGKSYLESRSNIAAVTATPVTAAKAAQPKTVGGQ